MSRWYSARGARRGLILAIVTALIWMIWAISYLQGITPTQNPITQSTTTNQSATPSSVNEMCCLQHLDI
jgi:hypothetical protein